MDYIMAYEHLNCKEVYSYLLVCILASLVLFGAYVFISAYSGIPFYWAEIVGYECGFDAFWGEPFFKHAFDYAIPLILFLIFDVELIFVLPWVLLAKLFFLCQLVLFYWLLVPILGLFLLSISVEFSSGMVETR
jgi:NADH-quinone oxidoreductase subunit A